MFRRGLRRLTTVPGDGFFRPDTPMFRRGLRREVPFVLTVLRSGHPDVQKGIKTRRRRRCCRRCRSGHPDVQKGIKTRALIAAKQIASPDTPMFRRGLRPGTVSKTGFLLSGHPDVQKGIKTDQARWQPKLIRSGHPDVQKGIKTDKPFTFELFLYGHRCGSEEIETSAGSGPRPYQVCFPVQGVIWLAARKPPHSEPSTQTGCYASRVINTRE